MGFKMIDGFLDTNVLNNDFNLAQLMDFHSRAIMLKTHTKNLRTMATVLGRTDEIKQTTIQLSYIEKNIDLIKQALNNKHASITEIGVIDTIYLN